MPGMVLLPLSNAGSGLPRIKHIHPRRVPPARCGDKRDPWQAGLLAAEGREESSAAGTVVYPRYRRLHVQASRAEAADFRVVNDAVPERVDFRYAFLRLARLLGRLAAQDRAEHPEVQGVFAGFSAARGLGEVTSRLLLHVVVVRPEGSRWAPLREVRRDEPPRRLLAGDTVTGPVRGSAACFHRPFPDARQPELRRDQEVRGEEIRLFLQAVSRTEGPLELLGVNAPGVRERPGELVRQLPGKDDGEMDGVMGQFVREGDVLELVGKIHADLDGDRAGLISAGSPVGGDPAVLPGHAGRRDLDLDAELALDLAPQRVERPRLDCRVDEPQDIPVDPFPGRDGVPFWGVEPDAGQRHQPLPARHVLLVLGAAEFDPIVRNQVKPVERVAVGDDLPVAVQHERLRAHLAGKGCADLRDLDVPLDQLPERLK